MDRIETQITFAEYRNSFVAELWLGDVHVAEVYSSPQGWRVELFCVEGKHLDVSLVELMRALEEAQKKLTAS